MLLALPLAAAAQITTRHDCRHDHGSERRDFAQRPGHRAQCRHRSQRAQCVSSESEDGSYRLEFLPVGNYVLEVMRERPGRKPAAAASCLQVNDTARVDVALSVGTVSEDCQRHRSCRSPINTSTAEIGRTIQSAEIARICRWSSATFMRCST